MDHSQRIKLLEQTIIQQNSVIENLTAAEIVLSARVEALQKMVTESLVELGFATPDQTPLKAAIWSMEREACHNQLAAVSDNDPRLATTLKTIIDQVLRD